MGALEDGREAAAAQVPGVRPGGSTSIHAIAQLLGIDTVAQRAAVSIDGSQPMTLPYLPGAYAGITTVLVLVNPLEGGRAVYVLGPVGTQAPELVPLIPPAPPASTTATAVILPIWSGTWRSVRSAWDRWNVGSYGGRSDLYQGNAYGSGPLRGLAVYGDQIVNLGATSILSASVTLVRSNNAGLPRVQGSPSGDPAPAGPPSSSGSTYEGVGDVELGPDLCEDLRTGAAKGLALVGPQYVGVFGTSRADGMALKITYTRAG